MEPLEQIRKAVERAKGQRGSDGQPQRQLGSAQQQVQFRAHAANSGTSLRSDVMLDAVHLESNRIISHDVADRRSKSFDMLRTQVLQTMDANSWQLLAVTSPTPGCGKSVIAINLALSIARQPQKPVLLVDMDLHKPQVANHLGLRCDQGLVSALEARAIIPARIGNSKILLLPSEKSVLNSSEWVASRSMSALLKDIKYHFKGWTVIFDLPPILLSDDVISILPQIDCVLFVAAAGFSTTSEIKECNKHLESIPVVRVVLNKAADATPRYYPYSYSRYGVSPAPQAKTNGRRSSKFGFGRTATLSLKRFVDRLKRF
jgi:protein-tyrosine kinase